MAHVRLNTKIVPQGHRVFSLFPGEGYKFREIMHRNDAVFMDYPDLTIPLNRKEFYSGDFVKKVARSEALAEWLNRGRSADKKPSSDLAAYDGSRRGPKRKRDINALEALFFELEPGDLIIVPDRGAYGNLLIGEIASGPRQRVSIRPVETFEEVYTGRRVRWLTEVPQHTLTMDFMQAVRSQNPVTIVGESYKRRIYSEAYRSFVFRGDFSAKFDVAGEVFSSRDDFHFQSFVNFVAAALATNDEQFGSKGITNAIIDEDEEFVPELAISIHSPGFIDLISKRCSPLVISGLYALACASCEPGQMPTDYTGDNSAGVEVTVGGDADDPCTAEVREELRGVLNSMGYEQWIDMCKTAQHLETDPRVTPPAYAEE